MRTFLFILAGCSEAINAGVIRPGLGETCGEDGCLEPYVCNQDAVCAEAGTTGTALVDSDCSASEECAYGLLCSGDNVCVEQGAEGTQGSGEVCGTDSDCLAGYACIDGACVDLEIPFWEGGPCPADDYDSDFKVLYDVPDLPTSSPLDFFAMPFPHDLRLGTDGKPMLDGFPSPGDELAPAVDKLLNLAEGQYGWGLDPVVYFRFNRPQDVGTFRVLTTDATIHFASIDEGSDDYGELDAFQFYTRTSRGRYTCPNWVAVSTHEGHSLRPNRAYAVWLTKGIESKSGEEVFRDDDFKVLMQDERPTDITDAKAYDMFAPFREYVDNAGLTRGDIVAATVFSTGDPLSWVSFFREVVNDEATTVTLDAIAPCAESPCGRDCGTGSAGEYHALVSIPDFTDGSGVSYSSSYRPQVRGTVQACAVVTYPLGSAPLSGWPAVIYQGDFEGTASDVVGGLADPLAREGVATISLDLPRHGPESTDPAGDWFDTESPNAWRGNMLQAYANDLSLVRLATEAALGFDPGELWFVGEGAGADAGVPLLAYSKDLRGGALGNPGGRLGHLFTQRTAPADVAHHLQGSFADSNLSRWHPLVNFLQAWMGPVDPALTAEAMLREPLTTPKHLLFVHGVTDGEVAPESLHAVLTAASIPSAGDTLDDYGQATTTRPVYENVNTDAGRRTAASIQVDAGHAALRKSEGETVANFVGTGASSGGSPTIE